MNALFEAILAYVPPPQTETGNPLTAADLDLAYNSYVGRIGIGRIRMGSVRPGQS